jgi:hypothetical protein
MPTLNQREDGVYFIRHRYLDFNTWQIDRDGLERLRDKHEVGLSGPFPKKFKMPTFFDLHRNRLIYYGESREAYWHWYDLTRKPTYQNFIQHQKLIGTQQPIRNFTRTERALNIAQHFVTLIGLLLVITVLLFQSLELYLLLLVSAIIVALIIVITNRLKTSTTPNDNTPLTPRTKQEHAPKKRRYEKWLG